MYIYIHYIMYTGVVHVPQPAHYSPLLQAGCLLLVRTALMLFGA